MAIPLGFGGRDYPDFGVSGLANTKVTITDMSELAVRLGSISRFDRSGIIIFEEAFKHGIGRWVQNSTPADAYVVPVSDYYSLVPYSALLATTSDLNSYSGISTYLPIPYVSPMGFEWHCKFRDEVELFYMWVQVHTGDCQYRVVVRIDIEDTIVDICNKGGTYDPVYTKALRYGVNSPFHAMKVVVDFLNETYVRLVVDGVDIDLTGRSIFKDAEDDESPHLFLYFSNNPGPSTLNRVYLDNIIITMDEPT